MPPTTRPVATGDVASYCDAADDYYATLDDYQGGLGLFPDQDERDDAFLEFAAENQDLGEQLLAVAPADIADDVAVVVDAFRARRRRRPVGLRHRRVRRRRATRCRPSSSLRCGILRFD